MAKGSSMSPLLGYLDVKPCPVMIVSKAPILDARPKEKKLSNSQEILFALLDKRFQRYVTTQRVAQRGRNSQRNDDKIARGLVVGTGNVQRQFSVLSQSCDEEQLRTANTTWHSKKARIKYKNSEALSPPQSPRPLSASLNSPSGNVLSKMGCSELAEHVVYRAKTRLRRRPKRAREPTANTISTCRPACTLPIQTVNKPYQWKQHKSKISMSLQHPNEHNRDALCQRKTTEDYHCRTNLSSPKLPQTVNNVSERSSSTGESLRGSFGSTPDFPEIPHSPKSLVQVKTVYLSEKHSITPKDTGIPNVPPCTPNSVYLRSFRYIQSMCDIKSQRQLKNRLHEITQRLRQKETTDKDNDIDDRKKRREEKTKLKAKQRAEIYALNATMRKHEEGKFQEFMSGKV